MKFSQPALDLLNEPVSYAALYEHVREIEGREAPGSETHIWEHFVSRMLDMGVDPHDPQDQTIPRGEDVYWREIYERLQRYPDVTLAGLECMPMVEP